MGKRLERSSYRECIIHENETHGKVIWQEIVAEDCKIWNLNEIRRYRSKSNTDVLHWYTDKTDYVFMLFIVIYRPVSSDVRCTN